jgi:hypothetical protein
VLTPTLLPNLLLATRTALFPANTRPSSQIAVVNIGDRASAPPQASVPSQKALATTASPSPPIAEGVKGPAASDTIGKIIEPKSNSNSGGSGGGPTSTTGSARPASLSSTAADAPTTASTHVPAEPEKRNTPSETEIAAIKRRCAASLLALIPRSLARTFFGVSSAAPPPCSGDRTCSTSTSPSLTTASPSQPPSRANGGVQPRPAIQGKEATLSSSPSLSVSSTALPEGSGHLAAERLRTGDDPSGIDLEEEYLLDTIENDILDVFADEYCNKHLIYSIIEIVLAKVLPEVSEYSVEDLLEDRGVASVPPAF